MRRAGGDMRVDGAIRVGLWAIDATWRGGSTSGAALNGHDIIAAQTAQPRQPIASVAIALGHVLDAAPRRGRFFSPHLRIMIADPYLQMAVIRFQQLPRSRGDLALLVTQRFCRDHRLEQGAATIAYAPQGEAQGERHVMVCALNAALAKTIAQSLTARDLHADIIAAESVFAIRALQTTLFAAPTLLLLLYGDYATIVLWRSPEVIGHVSVFQPHERSRSAFLETLRTRLERYGAVLARQQDQITVGVAEWSENSGEAHIFRDLPYPVRDIRREPALAGLWPSGPALWTAIAEQGG